MIPDSIRLMMVGLNHRTAPLELRESVAFSQAQAETALQQFRAQFPDAELVLLSTCNRVEFYLARPLSSQPSPEDLERFIAEFHGIDPRNLHPHLYHRSDRALVEHLFAVGSSLDSMVVGETQILSQVRQAYQQGCDTGSVGKALHGLFQRALAAAKEVHEKTEIAAGRLSIASVAVDLAASVFDRFDDKTVLCVGAGKMAALMLRHLTGLKPRKVLVTNRSAERAANLAAHFSAEARPFEQLDALLTEADILLTGTGAAKPIITESRFKSLLKARRYRPIVMIDIAVPRDIEPVVAKLTNVYLYNIDDLQEVAEGNRGKRGAEIAAAQTLLASHVEEYLRWSAARDVGPLVKALYEQANAVARAELEAHLAKHPDLPAEKRAELERLTHRLVGKLLHGPVTQLTTRAETTARPMLAEALRKLFELGE
jgi:glutamyl-tRNA reductase